jgi:biopolymer transport protein ExbB
VEAFRFISEAGIVGYILLFLSVVSLAVIIQKLITLRLSKLIPKEDFKLLADFIRRGSLGDAVELCKRRKNLLTEVVHETFKHVALNPTRETFLSAFEVSARKKMMELERGMALLATVAAISPLLGLLGTVIGMVKIFGVLTAGGGAIGNPQQLSAGIAEALLTTIFGLVVAIPAVVMYNLFNKKLDKIAAELEAAGVFFANALGRRQKQ